MAGIAKLKKCYGCEQDFYNGKNPYAVKECWHLEDMKIIWRRKISVNQMPPFTQPRKRYPDCYRQKGYAFYNKKQLS